MPRGRLIFPFLASVSILDTEATAAPPVGLPSGFDPVFREPVKLPDLTDPTRPTTSDARVYQPAIQVRCQVEPLEFDELQQMFAAGRSGDTVIQLILHYRDLERANLVASNGEPLIRLDDVLSALADRNGIPIRQFRSPGFYATQVEDLGFGLGTHRNLLLVRFEDRKRAQ